MKKTSLDSEDSVVRVLDVNSYNSLREQAWHRCEFCDHVFTTRYSMIKHNATHIIIPLLKLTLHQCEVCLFYFSSLEDLHIHTTNKHHNTSQESNLGVEYEQILQSIVEKQVVVKCHDTLNEVLNVKKETDNTPKSTTLTLKIENSPGDGVKYVLSDSDEDSLELPLSFYDKGQSNDKKRQSNTDKGQINHENRQSTTDNGQSNHEEGQSYTIKKEERESSPLHSDSLSPSHLTQLSSPTEPVQSRIMFEDDDDDDDDLFLAEEILPDKPYYPKQNSSIISDNLANYNKSKENSFLVNSQVFKTSRKVNGSLTDVMNDEEECYTDSVHYDELVAAELCDCSYCGRCFVNRFELIKHECTHMRASLPRPIICGVCERYLGGNHWALRRHMQKFHPDHDKKLIVQQCKICNLKYHNKRRHIIYYHQFKCEKCKRSYFKQDLHNHDCITTSIKGFRNVCDDPADSCKVIKMCEMCLAFCKNKQNIHYDVIGELSEVGNRQQCDRCHIKHFEVSLVSRKVRMRESTDYLKRKKPMSNEDRLKKIQKRLKMVNKMNKC